MMIQLLPGMMFPIIGTALGSACVFFIKGTLSDRIPVSYTHLDVYKRQGMH